MCSIKLLQKDKLLFTAFGNRSIFEYKVFIGKAVNIWAMMRSFNHQLIAKLTAESNGQRLLKIGQHLAKLSARVDCPVFLTHDVY